MVNLMKFEQQQRESNQNNYDTLRSVSRDIVSTVRDEQDGRVQQSFGDRSPLLRSGRRFQVLSGLESVSERDILLWNLDFL